VAGDEGLGTGKFHQPAGGFVCHALAMPTQVFVVAVGAMRLAARGDLFHDDLSGTGSFGAGRTLSGFQRLRQFVHSWTVGMLALTIW